MIHAWYCTTPPTFRFVVFSLAIPGCYICLILSPFRGSTEIALLESHYTASLDYIQSGVSVTASNVKVSHPYWRYSPGSIEVGKQAMCSLSYWKFDSPLHVYISTYSIDLDSTRWQYQRLVCCWFISGQCSLKLRLNLVLTWSPPKSQLIFSQFRLLKNYFFKWILVVGTLTWWRFYTISPDCSV